MCILEREVLREAGEGVVVVCRAEGWSWRGKRRGGDLGKVARQCLGNGAGVAREKALMCGSHIAAPASSLASCLSPSVCP